jgi:phosphate-selective porin OprO/OprP
MYMKKSIIGIAVTGAIFVLVSIGHTEEITSPQTLEQRLAILERKYENDQEAAAVKAKEGASVTAGKDGFAIKSNDGNYSLKITGYAQFDYRDYLGDHGSTQVADQFLLRRVRPTFDGTVSKYVVFRIITDLANGGGTTAGPTSSLVPDAYVELQYLNAAKPRFGKFKPPVGLENLQSDAVMPFSERSLVT